VAFALGLIAGRYVGGKIEQTFGWRANFAFYALYADAILLASFIGLRETLSLHALSTASDVQDNPPKRALSIWHVAARALVRRIYTLESNRAA